MIFDYDTFFLNYLISSIVLEYFDFLDYLDGDRDKQCLGKFGVHGEGDVRI